MKELTTHPYRRFDVSLVNHTERPNYRFFNKAGAWNRRDVESYRHIGSAFQYYLFS